MMSNRNRYRLGSVALVSLLTCAAFVPNAFAADDEQIPLVLSEPEVCTANAVDNPLAEAVELASWTCQGNYSVSCSGTGSTCAAATSAFTANCQSSANNVCAPDPTCRFATSSSGCTGGGGSFTVSGSATFGCKMVW